MLGVIILLTVFVYHRAEPINITKPAYTHNIEVIDDDPTTLAIENADITKPLSTPSSTQQVEVIKNYQSKTEKNTSVVSSILTSTRKVEVTETTTKNSTSGIFKVKSILKNSGIKSTLETIGSKSINESIKYESIVENNYPNKTFASKHCTNTSDCKISGQTCFQLEDSECNCINSECILSSKFQKNII